MKVYIETSSLIIFLFGKEKESIKYQEIFSLFKIFKSKNVDVIISFYTLHEIFNFCVDNFPLKLRDEVIRLAFLKLFSTKIIIKPLLKREERIVHKNKFVMEDSTDQVHVITAFVNGCDVIITYDSHFKAVKQFVNSYTPSEFIDKTKSFL